MLVEPIILEGRYVRLEPLAETHLPGLADAIADGELWRNPYTFVPRPGDLERFCAAAHEGLAAGRELAFAIVERAGGQVAGSTRFRNIAPHHRKLEIGHTFVARSWQRTGVNTEAKYLLLRCAFDAWQCQRVEFQTDVLNAPSRTAIARLGAREEGVLRSHYRMPDGRVRDTAVYSIVQEDWESVCAGLEAKLLAHAQPS